MPRFATNDELVAITGLQRQTLRLWVLRGLLPKPTLFSDGRDGVRTRWPYEAVERARPVAEPKSIHVITNADIRRRKRYR